MGVEQVALSTIATVGRTPWLADLLFSRAEWGNPFADERFRWPYPMYERMRADGPVRYGRPYRQWFVFGYDEVREVMRSHDTATAPVGRLLLSTRQYRRLAPAAGQNFGRWLITNDPPDHTRLRSAVSRAFTPRWIARYESLVDGVVDDLVAALDTSWTATRAPSERLRCRRRRTGWRRLAMTGRCGSGGSGIVTPRCVTPGGT